MAQWEAPRRVPLGTALLFAPLATAFVVESAPYSIWA